MTVSRAAKVSGARLKHHEDADANGEGGEARAWSAGGMMDETSMMNGVGDTERVSNSLKRLLEGEGEQKVKAE